MKKFKLYFDKDKEEKWLNEMSLQGWAMREFFSICFCLSSWACFMLS